MSCSAVAYHLIITKIKTIKSRKLPLKSRKPNEKNMRNFRGAIVLVARKPCI